MIHIVRGRLTDLQAVEQARQAEVNRQRNKCEKNRGIAAGGSVLQVAWYAATAGALMQPLSVPHDFSAGVFTAVRGHFDGVMLCTMSAPCQQAQSMPTRSGPDYWCMQAATYTLSQPPLDAYDEASKQAATAAGKQAVCLVAACLPYAL